MGKKSGSVSLAMVSFYTIVAAAVLYALALILQALQVNASIVGVLSNIATAVMVIVVAIVAWRYVANRPMVWKVLYLICLLVVIIGIIIPLVI